MKHLKHIALTALLASFLFAKAQDKKEAAISIQFLTSESIGDINFDKEPFFDYAKAVKAKCASLFDKDEDAKDVLVLVTFKKNSAPEVSTYWRPTRNKTKDEELLKELRALKPVKSLLVDYSLLYVVSTAGGDTNEKEEFTPAFIPPDDLEEQKMRAASLQDNYEYLKNWCTNFVLPVLTKFETSVDAQFVGVKETGKILESYLAGKKPPVNDITDKNENYWRGVMEMSAGNELIPITKIALHMAAGEFDYAKMYLKLVTPFCDKKTVARTLAGEMSWRLGVFEELANEKIQKGIAFHDKAEYNKAIAEYEQVIKEYPNSAWARYELYFSKNAQKTEKDPKSTTGRGDWDKSKPGIYACNPMYPLDVRASTGREAYLVFKRQSTTSLFKDKDRYAEDYLEYADIAFDLKNYGVAAQLYWLIITTFPEEKYSNRNIIAYYLYCLDKLGVKGLEKNFKGDFAAEFTKIEKDRKELMEKDPIYNSMEKPE